MRRAGALGAGLLVAACGGGEPPEGTGAELVPVSGSEVDTRVEPFLTAEEVVGWEGLPYDARIAYDEGEQTFGELRLPQGEGPFPVAVVLHGGCWMSMADHDYMDPLAAALTEAGWATWNLEFRSVDQEGGAWPGIFRDVATGVDHLRAVAAEHPLDLERVVTVGHSSGGHLALWAASRHRIPEGAELHDPDPLPVRGTVGLAAMADPAHYQAMGISWDDGCGDAPTRLLGGVAPSEAPERLAQASPAELRPTGIPQLLLTGAHDRAVPPEHGEAYAASSREVGQETVHHVVPGSAHFEIVDPTSRAWGEVWRHMWPFLRRFGA